MRPPKLIKPYVLAFARQVAPRSTAAPDFIRCMPLHGHPHNECFPLVEAYTASHGGACILGWAIWERPKVFIEAEFHAVWQSPDGALLDLAPRPVPIPRILFLPEPGRRYRGMQIDNVRKALTHDKDVQRFLDLRARRFKLLNEGKLKHYLGPVIATPELLAIDQDATSLEAKIIRRYGPWLPEEA